MDGYCSITVANHGLSRLIRFVSQFTAHPYKKFYNRLHLVLQISKIPFHFNAFTAFLRLRVGSKHTLKLT